MAGIWQVGRPIPLWLYIKGPDGEGITGLTPTVRVIRMSDFRYADWSTHTWVLSGGTRDQILPEAVFQNGLYMTTWDMNLWGEENEDNYMMVYRNEGAYKKNDVEHFTTSFDVSLALLQNVMRTHVLATVADPARNIEIGDLDKIVFKVKRQTDTDWTNPVYQGEVNLYNDFSGGFKYEKKSGGPE